MPIYPSELRNLKLAANIAYIGDAAQLDLLGAGGVVLASFTMATPFAVHPPAVPGVQAVTLPADTVGLADGTVVSARLVPADGAKAPIACSVGTSGQVDVVINNLAVATGQPVSVLSFAITAGNAA